MGCNILGVAQARWACSFCRKASRPYLGCCSNFHHRSVFYGNIFRHASAYTFAHTSYYCRHCFFHQGRHFEWRILSARHCSLSNYHPHGPLACILPVDIWYRKCSVLFHSWFEVSQITIAITPCKQPWRCFGGQFSEQFSYDPICKMTASSGKA